MAGLREQHLSAFSRDEPALSILDGRPELTAIALRVTQIQNTTWPKVIVSREKHGGREGVHQANLPSGR